MARGHSQRTPIARADTQAMDTGLATRIAMLEVAVNRAVSREGYWHRVGSAIDGIMFDPDAGRIFSALRGTPVLAAALPEVAAMDGFEQHSPYHPEGDLFTHTENVLTKVAAMTNDPDLRWAAMLHDTGKLEAFWLDEKGIGHFYANPDLKKRDHEKISAEIADRTLRRLGIADERRERIRLIVRHHMRARFATVKAARKFIATVGEDLVEPLLLHREADHEGSGSSEEASAKLRTLIEQARQAPETPQREKLCVSGGELINGLGLAAGPQIGVLVGRLQAEIASGALRNERGAVLARAGELTE